MAEENFVPPAQFRTIVQYAPLVSLDLVIADETGHVLVGLRRNEPARGTYFVPGGIIRKDEKLDDAFARILAVETGLVLPRGSARYLGLYEHFYGANRYEETGYGTHYVVSAYRIDLASRPRIRPDDQHDIMRWMLPADILAADDVRENVKAYFR
jgi:colanic acid biosynthesis protein WcaH